MENKNNAEKYVGVNRICESLKDMAEYQPPFKQSTILGVVSTIENYPAADVVDRNKLKQLIANKYGDLDNICGCNVNGQWLSVAAIVELIDQAAKE